MAGIIAKQPNGLYCRISTVVDAPTHWNMTEQDYIDMCVNKAKEEAENVLANYCYDFDVALNRVRYGKQIGVVSYSNKDCGFCLDKVCNLRKPRDGDTLEIIGNIHDKPELLKGIKNVQL